MDCQADGAIGPRDAMFAQRCAAERGADGAGAPSLPIIGSKRRNSLLRCRLEKYFKRRFCRWLLMILHFSGNRQRCSQPLFRLILELFLRFFDLEVADQ